MALVAADAGGDVLFSSLVDLPAVFGVVDPAAGHVDEIRAAALDEAVGDVRILEARRGGHGHLNAARLDLPAHVAHGVDVGGRLFLGGGEAQGMLGIHVSRAQMEDVADALHQLRQVYGVLFGVAAELLLVHGKDALQGEAPAHGLPQGGEHLHQIPGPVLQALVSVLVGAVVGDGGEQLGHGAVAVAAVDGDHVEAQGLEVLGLLAVVLDHGVQVLFGEGRDALLGTAVVLGVEVVVQVHAEVLVLGGGILPGHGGHIAAGTAGASGAAGTSRTVRSGTAGGAHAHAGHHIHVGGTHDVAAGLGAVEVDGVQELT